ncbi:putative oxidoreductase YghA [Methylobacterium crusticola]|uniref:Oxidoreductase YghA n=1 Tax=Methylobacterium crusticola TaxID=1697972 RepID=A0ABQ4R0B4_9HYPH|nr:SDR family oxidoreductase [Methylobacterium crusticola]GJD50540.1 putative oxidoreductase YghA [Methylobacterium crusticola]
MSDTFDPSRRRLMGGLTGIAALGGTAFEPTQAQAAAAESIRKPVSEYPKPPFQDQEQPWPGLASQMSPRPDHGETSYKGSGRLAGRKALLTGADSGIGRAAAIAFAREGADIAFNYLPVEEPDAREVVDLIRSAGRKAIPLPGDIRDKAFCRKLVEDATRELGGLDILVNNAVYQKAAESITDISDEDFDQTFQTNVYAMFWITKAAMKHLQRGSAIINTSSVNAYEPSETLIDYAATKAVVANFSKGLAKQLAAKGIRVNAVALGPFWTPLQVSGGKLPGTLPTFGGETPIGRPGQPAEIAGIYVLLASDEASYSTGQVFGAVGGRGGP